MTIINAERNYRELQKNVRMMNSQRSNTEKVNLIEEGKKKPLVKLLNTMKLLVIV